MPKINALEEAMEITLTEEEVRIGRYIASQKRNLSKRNEYRELKRDGRSHLEIMVQGLTAELAVAKALNIYPDLDSHPSHRDYPSIDHSRSC